MGTEGGGDLVLLDVEAVGLGVDAPVEALDIVARDVLAVLGKVDGEAEMGRAMEALDVAIH